MLPNRYLEVGRSEMMRAKREGEHAAVMQVVLDHMPDDPLTRKFIRLPSRPPHYEIDSASGPC
jgi:hypothetical protein